MSCQRKAVLDSESYWDNEVSIQKMCMKQYMSRSETYLWSIVTDDGYRWAGTTAEMRSNALARGIIEDRETDLWAVNSNFDQDWAEKDFDWMPKKTWNCVSDFSVSHQRPRALEHMHKALTGKEYSKVMRSGMKKTHLQELLSFEADSMKEYNLGDGDTALEDIGELEKLGPMTATETAVAAHTRMICRRGMAYDPEYIEKCRQDLEFLRFKVRKELPWEKDCPKILAPQHFNLYCCKMGVAPPANLRKGDEDFTDWIQANPKLGPVLKARQRYELANRKLQHIEKFLSRCYDGLYYPDLLYCGAPHTRRFSAKGSSDGSQDGDATHSGFNVQNMDRDPLFGDLLPNHFAPLCPTKGGKPVPGVFVRNWICPRTGKVFVILDFSQIEPRCLHWLIGNEAFLDLVRRGFSVYEAFARTSLGWAGGDLKVENDELYRLAKVQVLGLGYQCGVKKFPSVAWTLARLKIGGEAAEKAVYGFRNSNPGIADRDTGIWARMQKLCLDSALQHEPLEVQMPNGSMFRYFNVEQYTKYDEFGNGRFAYAADKLINDPDPRGRKDIYGGRITENITQRMARDLLVEAVLRLEAAGMPVCFHAHDEVILEVDADNAQDALQEAIHIMSEVPEWARGLPIGVSGGIYDRYTKAA